MALTKIQPAGIDSSNSTLTLGTSNVTAITIDGSQNVGIGNTSPGTKLDIYSSGTTSTIIRSRNDSVSVYLDADNGYSYLNTYTNHPMLFGTNNTERMRIDTSGNLLFNSGYGSAATAYGCRAWVNFDGTTATPSTIRGSGNVSSITKNSTGNYTINFATAMPDANYAVTAAISAASGANMYPPYFGREVSTTSAPTTTSFVIWLKNSANSFNDPPYVSLAIFR